jgi:hypothetical protein
VNKKTLAHWGLSGQEKEWRDLDPSGSEYGLDGRFFEYANES